MYKDIGKGNDRPTVQGVRASNCLGKVRGGEVLRGTGQRFRESSRGVEMLHQASIAEEWSPVLFWSAVFQFRAQLVLYLRGTHIQQGMQSAAEIPVLSLLGNSETMFPWSRLQTGLYHSVTLKNVSSQWAMSLMSASWSQNHLIPHSKMKQHCNRKQSFPKLPTPWA